MAHSISIEHLTPREAVADAIFRAVIGLDTKDRALFESAWVKDNACFERPGKVLDGMSAINKELFDVILEMDTHHTVSNIRVNIKVNGEEAYMTTYCLAQHHRKGEGMDPSKKGLLGGTTYFIDLVKDSQDGLWKMTKWTLQLNWCDGDLSVVGG